jgi:defect-in-organelle-trafficking protein DotD
MGHQWDTGGGSPDTGDAVNDEQGICVDVQGKKKTQVAGEMTWKDGRQAGFWMIALVATIALAGCAGTTVRFRHQEKTGTLSEPATEILSRAALRISRDWDRLLAYQSHLPPEALGISRIQKSGVMGHRFTMKYVGPVEPFLRRLGKTVRWGVKVIGRKPASQPMIEIRAKKEALYDILRDAGVQVSPAAWIVLRPEGREIDLIYPPPLPPKLSETKEGLANEK